MSRFKDFTVEEMAALHHALWSGWENATPSPGDVEIVYPKDVQCICERLLNELPFDPPAPGNDIPYESEDNSPFIHSSRGHNPLGWLPPTCKEEEN